MSKKKFLTGDEILSIGEDPWETHMRRFCEAVQRGEIPDPETLKFTATAFHKILEGQDPKQAFAVRRKRGPKREELGMQIAHHIENEIQNGAPRGEAIKDAASKFCRSEKLVERRYDENKQVIRVGMEMARAHSALLEDLRPLNDLFKVLLRKKPQ